MFIIVENNQVILGPMNWRKTAFENCILDDCEVEITLPKSNDERSSIIVNENIKILPVTDIGISNEYNSRTQWLNGPYYNFFDTYAEVFHTAYDKDINHFKSELKSEVAANRYKYEIKGITITIQGQEVFIYTNREDRNLYMQAFQLGSNNVNWKFGNTFLTLTNSELGTIVAAGATHIQSVFDWESSKVTVIDAASDLVTLAAISTKSDNTDWEPVILNPFELPV